MVVDETTQVNSKWYWILAVIFGLTSLIVVILTGVALNQASPPDVSVTAVGPGQSVGGGRTVNGKLIWTLAIGHDFGAHEYLNATGHIQGFGIDLINEVCNAAKITCQIVWDKYSNCWDSKAGQHASGGQGLLSGWYDACTAWYQTTSRLQVFGFSKPYLQTPNATFFVKKGTLNAFKPLDISNIQKGIGFLDGWASDEKCLAQQSDIKGSALPIDKIIYVPNPEDLEKKIVSGEVDAGFTTYRSLAHFTTLDAVTSKKVQCMVGGESVMTRKDSGFPAEWNRGFDIITSNGVFQKICGQTTHDHKGRVVCVNS